MIALNARTGELVEAFGKKGVVDLKLDNDQELDLTAAVGLNATPLSPAMSSSWAPPIRGRKSEHTAHSKRLRAGLRREDRKAALDFPHDSHERRVRVRTWLDGSAERNGISARGRR